jgi:hypothetical protein
VCVRERFCGDCGGWALDKYKFMFLAFLLLFLVIIELMFVNLN